MSAVVRPRASASAAAAVVGALAAATGLSALGLHHASAQRASWPAEADIMYLPSARVLKLLFLGHNELGADLVAARANVYFGAQIAAKAPQAHLQSYLNAAADLDPRFHRLYLSGAAMIVYNGQVITVDSVLAATQLLDRGRRQFPEDWELPFQLGFNKLFELPKLAGEKDPRVPMWRQEGVEAMRDAALGDGVPSWLPGLAARLLTKQGGTDLAIRHLEQAYAVTSSEETREQIRRKLVSLQRDSAYSKILEEKRQFEESLQKSYTYAPEAFSIIAGPRRSHTLQSSLEK